MPCLAKIQISTVLKLWCIAPQRLGLTAKFPQD